MLDEHEKSMARKLVNRLSRDDVMSLAQTVTNRKVHCTSHSEALQAIVDYSESGTELLKRQKVTKDILLQYLHSENVPTPPSADKQAYIDATLSHWRKSRTPPKRKKDSGSTQIKTVSPQRVQPAPTPVAVQQNNFQQNVQHITIQHNVYQQNITNTVNILPTTPTPVAPPSQHQQFGETFVTWFYKMLNSCTMQGTEFGPQHFFPDCKMNLLIAGQTAPEHFFRNEVVCKRLSRFIHEENIEFHPTVSADGVQCVESAQEEMQIRTCGTIRKVMQNVGVFEQHFRLLRDIGLGNNWRIKATNIGLSTNVPQQAVTLAITGGLPALD